MTNTQLRFVSAGVMLSVVGICLALDNEFALALVGLAGAAVTDEVITNFAKVKRNKPSYLFAMITFVAGYIYFNFIDPMPTYFQHFINGGIAINLVLVANLFFANETFSKSIEKLMRSYSFVMGFLLLTLFMNVANIIHRDQWQLLITALIVLNFSVDTFAWFFGKKFGKRKLMPTVSPKKTVEGAIGGALSSFVLTLAIWTAFFGFPNTFLVIGFFLLSSTSQLGDLIQSKLKRQFDIKDSSGIIPGHGGVYDRFDSLLFVAPFYALLINAFFSLP